MRVLSLAPHTERKPDILHGDKTEQTINSACTLVTPLPYAHPCRHPRKRSSRPLSWPSFGAIVQKEMEPPSCPRYFIVVVHIVLTKTARVCIRKDPKKSYNETRGQTLKNLNSLHLYPLVRKQLLPSVGPREKKNTLQVAPIQSTKQKITFIDF